MAAAAAAHLDVEDSDEVGPLGVVLDQAGHPTAPLHPVRAPVSSIHLDHSRAQRLGAEITVRWGEDTLNITQRQSFPSFKLNVLSCESLGLMRLFDSVSILEVSVQMSVDLNNSELKNRCRSHV